MRRYKFELTIEENHDEYLELLNQSDETGCDELIKAIKESNIFTSYPDAKLKLVEYTND